MTVHVQTWQHTVHFTYTESPFAVDQRSTYNLFQESDVTRQLSKEAWR